MKQIAVLQDLSCFGKCALTVALPVLSAAGYAVSPLPTAVLSAHTGGLGKPHVCDLTSDLPPILEHWKTLGLRFDGVYTGYLASPRQAVLAKRLIREFAAEGAITLCDPAMGDHGKLYSGLPEDMPAAMACVCACADVIVPNFTEARLLGAETAEKLAENFGCRVVLTGAEKDGMLGAEIWDGKESLVLGERLPGAFHGTGDLFAAVLLAALLREKTTAEATRAAVDFTHDVIAETIRRSRDERFGLCFEPLLPSLPEYLA